MSAPSKLIAWVVGALLASGALAWAVKDFTDREQQKGADKIILAQTASSNDTIARALRPLLKQSIDTMPAHLVRDQLYVPVRDSVIATLYAIDSVVNHPAIPSGGSLSPHAAVPDSGAKPLEVPAALSPLPASAVPVPALDPAQVRRALRAGDSTIKVCTVPFATCAMQNSLYKQMLHNDTLTIRSLLDEQPTTGDRIRHDVAVGAIGATLATILLLVFHH